MGEIGLFLSRVTVHGFEGTRASVIAAGNIWRGLFERLAVTEHVLLRQHLVDTFFVFRILCLLAFAHDKQSPCLDPLDYIAAEVLRELAAELFQELRILQVVCNQEFV